MAHTDDDMFRAAVAAAMMRLGVEHPDYKRIPEEVRLLAAFSSTIQTNMLGGTATIPEIPADYKPVGLVKMWNEAKEARDLI